jgi:hypothetical protein
LYYSDKNPPVKRVDKGGNPRIRSIEKKGIQHFIDGEYIFHDRILRKHTLTLWQDRGHLTIILVRCYCQFIVQANETTTDRKRKEQHCKLQQTQHVNKNLLLSRNWSSHMQMTQSSEAANNENRFGMQSINLTNNNKIHGGEQLTKNKLNARFSTLTASQLQQFHSEA